MTTRPTFEDRLLAELHREIDLRAGDLAAEDRTTDGAPTSVWRRRRTALTAPRLGLVALACAAVAGAWVLVPGSPAESPAYAVVSHPDGTLTVTMNEFGLGGTLPDGLVERLKAHGIHVVVDDVPDGYECTQPRGEAVRGRSDADGGPGRVFDLRRGDSLAVEKMGQRQPDGSFLPVTGLSFLRGEAAPCNPVPAPPRPGETSGPR
ncbi:hypothetical protein BN159_4131 [Streptomyces davaonensis JCM 4913]|uniref:Uncharacterized protein n=1 Tax=Streptomyces davaonensis (strain DSM 101723 / JCM 4913 / KCC S-0913 / 768) TaxID=1214101 RepID=K4R614_STRDJ|nr:hypothetical protein [Streptomyces davaonensis]CCK28510.1 hypothetical protein BN159_4131 [Streptomyces davaonensis JCM 4913]